jgi:hypothetical protein
MKGPMEKVTEHLRVIDVVEPAFLTHPG